MGSRLNTYGAGHIQRMDLMQKLLDIWHPDTVPVQDAGIPFIVRFKTVAGTATKSWTAPFACKVIDAWFIMTGNGGGGDTLQLKNGSTAITEAYDTSAASTKDKHHFATVDDANNSLAATGVLNCVQASDALAEVYATLIKV